ncbi:hypothetical protein [Streptomyces sp. NPDC093109]|uniref:hypothetical protein n=1 Tax=Streptomyces sp. NPDC093109 TaxID=3154977 RepID=UPI00344D7D38
MKPVATATATARVALSVRTIAPRTALATVPVLSLGTLGFVPSLVIAARRRERADWIIGALFGAATIGWILRIALTPVDTEGLSLLADFLLLLVSTLGASVHGLLAYPSHRPAATSEQPADATPLESA